MFDWGAERARVDLPACTLVALRPSWGRSAVMGLAPGVFRLLEVRPVGGYRV